MGMVKDAIGLTLQLELAEEKKTPENSSLTLRKEQVKTYFRSSCIRVLTIHIGFIKEFVTKAGRNKTKQKQIENVITEQIQCLLKPCLPYDKP